MQLKITSNRKLRTSILIGGAIFLVIFLFATIFKNVKVRESFRFPNFATERQQVVVRQGLPVRLKIPRIDVNAAIEYVSVDSVGAMEVPKNIRNVSWFEPGVIPGEEGSAVMAGHYGWNSGKVSVFDNLSSVRKGDMIYVENDEGIIISFMVREIKTYDAKAGADDVFSSDDGKSHLNLITCEGVWNKYSKSYSNRQVVFADKVDPARTSELKID